MITYTLEYFILAITLYGGMSDVNMGNGNRNTIWAGNARYVIITEYNSYWMGREIFTG